MKNLIIISCLLNMTLVGCATMKESILLGVSTGAATGALTGATIAQQNKGRAALTSAAVGAAIGGIASYFIHQGMERRDQKVRRETLFNLDKFGVDGVSTHSGNAPAISFPVVEEQEIDAQVNGKKLIGPHKVWVISEDAHWLLDSQPKNKKDE